MTDADDDQAAARRAHLAARRALEDVRAAWGAESDTASLPDRLRATADDDAVADLASLYLFAARVGGGQTDDPSVAVRWLSGWTGARARVPDDGRAALDAGIAFASRLHTAMGIDAGGA